MDIETSQQSFSEGLHFFGQNPSLKRHGYLLHAARNMDYLNKRYRVIIKKYNYIIKQPTTEKVTQSQSFNKTDLNPLETRRN